MMVAVAIMIILSAVTMVGVAAYAKQLKIDELDNAARSIYMAAQNRATSLSNGNRLEKYVVQGDNLIKNVTFSVDDGSNNSSASYKANVYYIHMDNISIKKLIPKDSIESSIWDGDFYIIYEPKSNSVVDVFYAESEMNIQGDFESFYETWRYASQKERMSNKTPIGHYGGSFDQTGKVLSIKTPAINIYNKDELKVEITYWLPRTFQAAGWSKDVKLDVKLQYPDAPNVVLDTSKAEQKTIPAINDIEYKYTWVLDSLNGKKFKELFNTINNIELGKDFTVSAELYYDGSQDINLNTTIKDATDNSLFASGTTEQTANIAYLRHLQNLDVSSGVINSIKMAEQIDNVNQGVNQYIFKPIENSNISSYNGNNKYIKNININGNINTGIFSSINGEYENEKIIKNIKIINGNLKSDNQAVGYAGLIAGYAEYTKFQNCYVYWEPENEQDVNIRNLLGDTNNGLNYKVVGSTVGGLVGKAENCKIENSCVATLISGNTVGGFVGQAQGVDIIKSYSSSYINGASRAGEFVGFVNYADDAKVLQSYASGFIYGDEDDFTQVTLQNSYIAVARTKSNGGTDTKIIVNDKERKYEELTNPKNWEEWFGKGNFELAKTDSSKPYNLNPSLSLSKYPYPLISGMVHYGDWFTQFENGSLVYYEVYSNNTYGFSGGGVEYMRDDMTISKDGYALLLKRDKPESQIIFKSIGYKIGKNENKTIDNVIYTIDEEQLNNQNTYYLDTVLYTNPITGLQESYYILPLPEEVVNVNYATNEFYQPLSISSDLFKTKQLYYNPHFAKASFGNKQPDKKPKLVEVRTARQLNMLGKYTGDANSGYNFTQTQDIDASTYTGYNMFQNGVCVQAPIGIDKNSAFKANYYGNGNVIKNFKIKPKDQKGNVYRNIGLFGYNSGNIKDVVYFSREIDKFEENSGNVNAVYVGGLVGQNTGSIYNCAVTGVTADAHAYNYSYIHMGGFVGANQGNIQNCSADVKDMKIGATIADSSIAGFVGENMESGSISHCYAVGSLHASQARDGKVFIAGFSANNQGKITNCYSANNLSHEGEVTKYGFGNNGGYTRNCVVLNNGSFSYNGVDYTAQYESKDATSVTHRQLTGKTENDAIKSLGMNREAYVYNSANAKYPYPAVVVDKNNNLVHYGLYPDKIVMGNVGVYYWEKIKTAEGNTSYNFSALSIDTNEGKKTIKKHNTLLKAHNDGSVIQDFGYGYYYSNNIKEYFRQEKVGNEKVAPIVNTLKSEGIAYGYRYAGSNFGKEPKKKWIVSFNPDMNDKNKLEEDDPPLPVRPDIFAAIELQKQIDGNLTFMPYSSYSEERMRGLHLMADVNATDDLDAYIPKNGKTKVNGIVEDSFPEGKWTINFNEEKFEFSFNPFFADTVRFVGANTQYRIETESGVIDQKTVDQIKGTAGTKTRPYEIRSVQQLKFINWNSRYRNTTTVSAYGDEKHFMFLSMAFRNRTYYWKQTHDLECGGVEDFVPIGAFIDMNPYNVAEDTLYDGMKGFAISWFGGSYDGNNYVIKELSIKNWEYKEEKQGNEVKKVKQIKDTYNTAGLFAITVNAELKNIVMYSPSGQAEISLCSFNKTSKNQDLNTWYAMGGLVGIAIVDNDVFERGYWKDNFKNPNSWQFKYKEGEADRFQTITNCSVSGYNIIDSNDRCDFGGAGVGGLVGICNMALSECTASNNIILDYTHGNNARNVRVGGLAGTCQKSIQKCYALGSIKMSEELKQRLKSTPSTTRTNLYIGDLVGGYFMKTLFLSVYRYPDGQTDGYCEISSGLGYISKEIEDENRIPQYTACYTYVDVDTEAINTYANAYYLVGGMGEIKLGLTNGNSNKYEVKLNGESNYVAKYKDCYFLDFGVNKVYLNAAELRRGPNENEPTDGVTTCSYSDLSVGGYVFNKFVTTYGFGEVTKVSQTGEPINGRYSFSVSPELIGSNYPFPTILTQQIIEDGKGYPQGEIPTANVHYGDWPVEGIKRSQKPINIDLFADYDSNEKKTIYKELLEISKDNNWNNFVAKWEATITQDGDNEIAKVNFDDINVDGKKQQDKQMLVIEAIKEGYATLNLSCEVNYTYSGDKITKTYTKVIPINITADLNLKPANNITVFSDEKIVIDFDMYDVNGKPINQDLRKNIKVTNILVNDSNSMFASAVGEIGEDKNGIKLNITGKNITATGKLVVDCNYTYNKYAYKSISVVDVQAKKLEDIQIGKLEFFFKNDELTKNKKQNISNKGFVIEINGTDEIDENGEKKKYQAKMVDFRNPVEYSGLLEARWNDEKIKDNITIEVSRPKEYSENKLELLVPIQIEFSYDSSEHKVWINYPVEVSQEKPLPKQPEENNNEQEG